MPKRRLNPAKLLLSKWTAVVPIQSEKHFLVTKILNPEAPVHELKDVVLEAVLTRRSVTLPWQELTHPEAWRQGWH